MCAALSLPVTPLAGTKEVPLFAPFLSCLGVSLHRDLAILLALDREAMEAQEGRSAEDQARVEAVIRG